MFYPDSCFSKSRKSTYVYPIVECIRLNCKTNERRKLSGNLQRVANLSASSPVFSSCIIYTFFQKFQDISKFLSQITVKLCVTEDKNPKYAQRKAFPRFRSIRAEIRFKAKTIVTSLPRDIYSDRPKNNILIKFSVCVIHVL